MARLPTLTADNETSVTAPQGGPRYPSHIASPGAVGDAIAGLGRQLSQEENQEDAAQNQSDYTGALSAVLTTRATTIDAAKDDPNWQDLSDRYNATMKQTQADAAASIKNTKLRESFMRQTTPELISGLSQVQGVVRERQRGQDRGTLQSIINTNTDSALSLASTDADGASKLIQTTDAAIEAAGAKGTISPEETVNLRRATVMNYGKSWLALQTPEDKVRILSGSQQGGQPAGDAVKTAILGQESNNSPNAPPSVTGAIGPGQVEPATFKRFAKPGEDIHNPADNRAVSGRYVDYLSALPNVQGDPARIAVGYFSGENNIAPLGSATPWKADKADPTGKTTSSYVSDVQKRIGRGQPVDLSRDLTPIAKTGTPADFIPLPEREVALREAQAAVRGNQAAGRGVFTDQVRDSISFLQSGGDPSKVNVTPDQIRATLPAGEGEQLAQELAAATDYAHAVQKVSTMPESELSGFLASKTPTGPEGFRAAAGETSALQKAMIDRQKAIYGYGTTPGDPVSYVTANMPDVAAARVDAMDNRQNPAKYQAYTAKVLGAQAALGIPPEFRRVMAVGEAKSIVSTMQSGSPQDALGLMTTLKKTAGSYWPQVYADLARAGLPGSYQALVIADPHSASTIAAALGKDAESRAKGAPMAEAMRAVKFDSGDGNEPTSVTGAVESQMARDTGLQSLRTSFGVGGRTGAEQFNSVYDAVRTTALYLFQTRGLSPAAAASQAAAMVTGQFDFVQQPGKYPLRLPKGTSDDFHGAAQATIDGLKPSDMKPLPTEQDEQGHEIAGRPEQERSEQALEHAKNAYWISVPGADGKGAVRAIDPQSDTPIMVRSGPAPAPSPQQNFARNSAVVKPGEHVYNTPLPQADEAKFRQWVTENHVPFNPNAKVSDYDMRGFWKALQAGDAKAKSAVDANDGKIHYPDYWKTPYHQTFSNESQWAGPGAPHWTGDDKLVTPHGTVVFDDRNQPQSYKPLDIPFAQMKGRGTAKPTPEGMLGVPMVGL